MIDSYLDDHAPVLTSRSTLWQFAAICLVIFGALAVSEYFKNHQVRAVTFAALAVLLGFGGFAWSRGIRPVFVTAMAISTPIGWVVSHLLLAALFFGLFTPIALLFKLIGRDALRRRFASEQQSYWEPKPAANDVRSYLRQS